MILMTVHQSSRESSYREFDVESVHDVLADFEALSEHPDVEIALKRATTGDELLVAIDKGKFVVGWADSTGIYELDDPDHDGPVIEMLIGGQLTTLPPRNAATRQEAREAISEFIAGARSSRLLWA